MADQRSLQRKPAAMPHPVEAPDGERAAQADTPCTGRARFFDSSNAFNLSYPPVPCHQFLEERDRALDPATGTAVIALDLSDRLDLDLPRPRL